MSCCSGCQHGLGCDGLGAIPAIEASTLNKYVVAGSVIEWGGYLSGTPGTIDKNSHWNDRQEGVIKDFLWQSGGFSMVDAGKVSGVYNEYISIRVTTRVDFSKLADVLGLIEHAIYATGLTPGAQHFWVVSVPAGADNNPNAVTPNAGAVDPSQPSGSFDLCKYLNLPYVCYSPEPGTSSGQSDSNPIDKLASWLGIGATEAAVIGAVAVVAGILIVKKAL